MALGSSKPKKPRLGPLDRKLELESGRDRATRHEAAAARDYGGVVTRGSGATAYDKADVKRYDMLIECKTTSASSYRVEFATLVKVTHEAFAVDKAPALEIEITGTSDPLTSSRWIMVPAGVMADLLGDR